MKRLNDFYDHSDEVINGAVLQYFSIRYNDKVNIADPSGILCHSFKREMIAAIQSKFPGMDINAVKQLVACIIRNVMKINATTAMNTTAEINLNNMWASAIDESRQKLIKYYSASSLSNDEVLIGRQ